MIAYASSGLPFAIWNLKGYFDTIPKELEESSLDRRLHCYAVVFQGDHALILTGFGSDDPFSFMTGWTEFVLAVIFLSDTSRYTLAIALNSMQGQYSTPWSDFSHVHFDEHSHRYPFLPAAEVLGLRHDSRRGQRIKEQHST